MGKSSAPPPPDYAALLPLQEASFRRTFDTMLNASRVNSQTPYGTQRWVRPSRSPLQGQLPNLVQPPSKSAPPPPFIDVEPGFGSSADGGQTSERIPNPAYTEWLNNQKNFEPGGNMFQQPDVEGGYSEEPWTLIQEFSPEQQALYDQDMRIRAAQGNIAEGMLGTVKDIYGKPTNFADELPRWQDISPATYGQYGPYRQQQWRGPSYQTDIGSREDAERAIYNRQARYALPELDEAERRTHERLMAMGFHVNDPAYKEALGRVDRDRARVMADIRDQAILGGGQEASAELQRGIAAETPRFGAAQSEGQFAYNAGLGENRYAFTADQAARQFMAAQQQAALEAALQRMQAQERDRARALNEMNAFRTGQQVQLPGTPAQFSTPNLQAADPMAAAKATYEGQLGAWNARQASADNFMSGLFGLGGALLGGPAGSAGGQLMAKLLGGW